MTDAERKALVERLREEIIADAFAAGVLTDGRMAERLIRERAEAAAQLQALDARVKVLEAENERLREALTQIEAGTYPRPLGKPWRMDLSSSKHDRCIHDKWMYETCEQCLDDFVRAALKGTKP